MCGSHHQDMLTKWLVADSKSLQCITGYLGIVANVANDKVATGAICLSLNYSFMIDVFLTFIRDSYVISYSFKFATPAPNGPSFHESFEISSETRSWRRLFKWPCFPAALGRRGCIGVMSEKRQCNSALCFACGKLSL